METLAIARFKADSGNKKYDVTLELVPSEDFAYGNKHALIYTVGADVKFYDARYDKRFATIESFDKNAYSFVRDLIRNEFNIVRIA